MGRSLVVVALLHVQCPGAGALSAAGPRRPSSLAQLLLARRRAGSGSSSSAAAARADSPLGGAARSARPLEDPLYPVTVTYDRRRDPAWQGVTVSVDPAARALHAQAGLNPAGAVAWARFDDELSKTGWTELVVETTDSTSIPNDMRMYGAGLAEGLLTAVRMSQFYTNAWKTLAKDENGTAALVNVQNMFGEELAYVTKQSRLHKGVGSREPKDPYWKHVRYLLVQLCGIRDGYNVIAGHEGRRKLDLIDMLTINSHADLPELMEAYTPAAYQARQAFQSLADSPPSDGGYAPSASPVGTVLLQRRLADAPAKEVRRAHPGAANATELAAKMRAADRDWESRLTRRGHCSALVRLAPESAELMLGHTTWSDYGKMTRIFKYYNFKLPGSKAATTLMGFSSYPGCVTSTDDFYMMDSGLVAMDTTLEVLNAEVYNRLPEFPANPHIPGFMHVMAVNRLAHTGMDWTNLFASRNNGIPSTQWLIVDYNRFVPQQPVRDNLLRMVEQVPGLSRELDLSHRLGGAGYWASYNRPFSKEVRDASGHTAAEAEYGKLYSFDEGPRATIFKHLATSISDLFGLRGVMNRNTYPNEGVLPVEPGHAISARMDLDAASHLPNGGIDAKVLDRCLFRAMQCQATSGPTHDSQPVFRWRSPKGTDLFPGWPHLGLPDVWNFSWVQLTPSKLLPVAHDAGTC